MLFRSYIKPEHAAVIARNLPNTVAAVGVFVDAPRSSVRRIANEVGLDVLQFHGRESGGYCRGWTQPVIKAFRVGESLPDTDGYRVFARLYDSGDGARFGGTGRAFDHRLLAGVPGKVFLAGGLGPDTVTELPVDPFAVDACSGLETAPGIKDTIAVERFARAAKDRTRFGRFGGRVVPAGPGRWAWVVRSSSSRGDDPGGEPVGASVVVPARSGEDADAPRPEACGGPDAPNPTPERIPTTSAASTTNAQAITA